ncbi:kinase-like domain-containing protein [Ephemerocybe angulata]|uniref:non-specific serine/threonine protein kinase n=1 Tax=Ephemerocybe angulata TaxID=980116 RepID=A0A8H6HB29_9AGAR|nr:kinase-like domain-containing protein [Tulosesus angulatus]
MASFPEEPLNLSAADGSGYFPADINQTLHDGKYTVVRKLGWGPRSSTWLVKGEGDEDETEPYSAAQIFTVSASKGAETSLLPILQNVLDPVDVSFAGIEDSFWEESVHGKHMCFVNPEYGLPLSGVLKEAMSNRHAGLPVHSVQFTVVTVLEALEELHQEKVMHSGIKLENLAFWPADVEDELEEHLAESPTCKAEIIDGLPTVRSQPLANYEVRWDDPMRDVTDWLLELVGYGHVQVPPYAPEGEHDYSSAPETLLGNPTCGLSTDVWMLGCLAFELVTGTKLFTSTGTPSEQLGEIRDVLQETIPDAWQGDPNVQALQAPNTSVESLEERLRRVLKKCEATEMFAFLQKCLVINPGARQSAKDLRDDDWLKFASQKCRCCYEVPRDVSRL